MELEEGEIVDHSWVVYFYDRKTGESCCQSRFDEWRHVREYRDLLFTKIDLRHSVVAVMYFRNDKLRGICTYDHPHIIKYLMIIQGYLQNDASFDVWMDRHLNTLLGVLYVEHNSFRC